MRVEWRPSPLRFATDWAWPGGFSTPHHVHVTPARAIPYCLLPGRREVCRPQGEVLEMILYFDVIPCEVWPERRWGCQ